MKKTAFLLIVLCSAALLLWGCVSSPKKDNLSKNETFLEPSIILKFNDIPIPAGFKLVPKDSYSFESGNVRVGILKYQGNAIPDQVVNFYREQMAMYNWNLLNTVEYGERLLNFERENETCIITLSPKGNNITLTISVGPKAQNLPKKAKEPVK